MLDLDESVDDLRERIAALVASNVRLGRQVQQLTGLLERVQRTVGGETLGDAVARVEEHQKQERTEWQKEEPRG